MLLQIILHHPEAIPTILKSTPIWVWGLFVALLALGISQIRDRTLSAARAALTPVTMTGFSIWGIVSAFSATSSPALVLTAWLIPAAVVFTIMAATGRASGSYDASTHTFRLPGSYIPLVLILAVFLTKYTVGVELGIQPALAQDLGFALPVAILYGALSGLFVGRAGRLWRLPSSAREEFPTHAVKA